MRPVWEVLHPYPEVAEGNVTEDSFVISIGGIWEKVELGMKVDVDARYLDPEGFYRRTHFTDAMKHLLSQIIMRLSGSRAQSVHHLQVGMGGGKSHTLLLLYYLSRYKDKALPYLEREGIATIVPPFKVAVLDGMRQSATYWKSFPDGSKVLTMWGLLFKQLGVYEKFKESDKWEEGPDVSMIKDALSRSPTLILIDEITFYIANLPGRLTNRVQAFLQAMTAAVKETPGSAMVVTTPIGVYPEELKLVSDVLSRYCSPTIVAASKEYKNIRRRALYKDDFDSVGSEIEEVAREYEACLKQHLPERASTIHDAIIDNYPFHPFVDRTLQRIKNHEAFQEIRDELRFLAGLIYSVQKGKDPDVTLISVGHANLEDQYVRGGTITKLKDPLIVSSLDTDLEERLKEIPKEIQDIAKRVLATIVLNSLSRGSPLEQGITRDDAIFAHLTPRLSPTLIDEALNQIIKYLWFVNPQADRYVFGKRNLNKIIDDYVKKVERDRRLRGKWWDLITKEIIAWKGSAVKQYASSAQKKRQSPLFNQGDIILWVSRNDEIPDDTSLKLVLIDYTLNLSSIIAKKDLTPEERALKIKERLATSQSEACEVVKDLYENYGQKPRDYKNTVFFLVADKRLVEKNGPIGIAKELLALEEMLADREELKILIGEKELERIEGLKANRIKDLKPSSMAAYQYLVYPSSTGLQSILLGEERRAIDQILILIEDKLESQARKILRSVSKEALCDRYWPKGKDRVEVKALINGFYRRPEIEVISDKNVVDSVIREALKTGFLAYMHQEEIFYNKEPFRIDDDGILIKNPDVVTVSIEAVDEDGAALNVLIVVNNKTQEATPKSISDLRGITYIIRPITPQDYIFAGWSDGVLSEAREIDWDKTKTLVINYEKEERLPENVILQIKAVNIDTNEPLFVAISINGISTQTPVTRNFLKGKRCEVSIGKPNGMSFNGWSDQSPYQKRSVTCDYDKVIIAEFKPVPPEQSIEIWQGDIDEGIIRLEKILDESSKMVNIEFYLDYPELTKNIGALLQLLKTPYDLKFEADGGEKQGFEVFSVTAQASSDKKGNVRSCLNQLKSYLENATIGFTKEEEEYNPLNSLVTEAALEAIEKMKGNMRYEIHVLKDPTKKPEPSRSLKGLIDEFKKVG